MRTSSRTFLLLINILPIQAYSQEAALFIPIKEWTMGKPAEGVFLSAQGLTTLPDGSILVSDKLANALVLVDMEGRIQQTLQNKGTTLGALSGPGPVAAWKDMIAVADFARDRIQILASDLTPLLQFTTVGPVFSLDFDVHGNLWVGVLRGMNGETLFQYDRDGVELRRLKTQVFVGGMFEDIFHLACAGDKLYLIYSTRNVVECWDLDGTPLGTTPISGFPAAMGTFPHTEPGTQYGDIPLGPLFSGLAVDSTGRGFVLAGDVAPQPRRDVYEINKNGEIVSFFTLPDRASAICFDAKGRLLVIENRKTTISCYRLERQKGSSRAEGETKTGS
jgi:hypothetical protein